MSGPRPLGTDLRRAILDTTRRLLIEEGYNNLSMRKIAGAVGCSATSIYLHFENKDALFHALIDEGMAQLYEALEAVAEEHPAPVARVEALCRAYVRFGLDNPEYYEVMFQLHPERMDRYPAENYRRARRNLVFFADALAAGAEAGDFEIPPPDIAAHVIWSALHGTVSLLMARRIDVRLADSEFVEEAVRHTLAGYLRPVPVS